MFSRLYTALILPVMDYESSVVATADEYAEREFGKVQRKAMVTATGCMSSAATKQLELLTNTIPMAMHLKCKNAEELVRNFSKIEEHPIKSDLKNWITAGQNSKWLYV